MADSPSPPVDPPTRAPGLAALVVSSFSAALLLPAPTAELALHPSLSAGLGTLLIATWLIAAPGTRLHRLRWEKNLIATFLALMPVVYLNSLLLTRAGVVPLISGQDTEGPWLWLELAGLPVFVALALIGARRAPWLLGAGIIAHGLLWDSWHIGRTPFMPDWYAVACLIVDVGWGLWALTRTAAWQTQHVTS